MDRGFIRRQLYHMMFLESNENDIFETIAYNDAEYLNSGTVLLPSIAVLQQHY